MSNKGKQVNWRRYTDAEIIKAIEAARGKPTAALKALGCSPTTFYKRMHASVKIQEALKQRRELELDKAEIKLFEAIDDREPWAVCFFLKTIGRSRGYNERPDYYPPQQPQLPAPAQPITPENIYDGIEYVASWLMQRGLLPTTPRTMVEINPNGQDGNGYAK